MTDNGGNDRRRDIEGRINTLGTGSNGVSGRGRESRRSRDASEDEEDGVGAALSDGEETDGADEPDGDDAEPDAEIFMEEEEAELGSDEQEEAEPAESEGDGAESEDEGPFETRTEDVDQRSSLEVEMDRFVRAFAARRAAETGEESLDEYIVGSVKGYLAGLLGGDVESPGTLEREVEIEADEIFGGLLETLAGDDQSRSDVVIEAIAETYDVPEEDSLVVAGLRDHEALLNGVVANSSNDLGDVSEVVQAAVETRLIEEPAA